MCGKQKQQQQQAAAGQSALSGELAGIGRSQAAYVNPYLQSRVTGGLPFRNQMLDFSGGTLARSFAPARADLLRRLSAQGGALPSGFREQALTDLGTGQARAFDDTVLRTLMLDEETRRNAAQMANPAGYFGAAQQGYQSVLGAPPRPGLAGPLIGAGGAITVAAIMA